MTHRPPRQRLMPDGTASAEMDRPLPGDNVTSQADREIALTLKFRSDASQVRPHLPTFPPSLFAYSHLGERYGGLGQ